MADSAFNATATASGTLFVTGTDTGVGKTLVSCALLRQARACGFSAAGFKPVASGCSHSADGLRNEDALALLAESSAGLTYAAVNPIALESAIAPHIAAQEAGIDIDPLALTGAYVALAQQHQRVVVEGAGGWRVPLNAQLGFDDWVAARQWPVLLVVGMRLGCINHALLSADAILRRTRLAGWVANVLPPEQMHWQDNVDTLRARMPAPLCGIVALGADVSAAAAVLSVPGFI
ncbi:MAG: dethiobiotin synthase [Pseudomonadota bacterium]|nr:dethiobiotin synthase [Pseudomonadota bacterium]